MLTTPAAVYPDAGHRQSRANPYTADPRGYVVAHQANGQSRAAHPTSDEFLYLSHHYHHWQMANSGHPK